MRIIIAAAAVFVLSFAAHAQTATKELAARVELHAFQSLTLSDQQFLTGDRAGAKPVTLTGELRVAQGTGKLPLVILMHGSGGIGSNMDAWVRQFNAMGLSTFVIDGFTGRGLTSVSGNQALLGRLNFIADIYQALEVMAKHPRVDPARIALVGFSRGGQAALYASLDRFHRMWNTSGAQFVAYIPFYPDCATSYIGEADIGDRKVRIFHGAADDFNPVASCKAYVQRLRDAKRDAELTEYANAFHVFDNPIGPVPATKAATSQTVRDCAVRETEGGALINTATNVAFAYTDTCVKLGPHIGANAEAAQAATRAVSDILRAAFKLD
ncbi:MAG TPA: dienelactone hydrolase family protein [Hyphomicrobiaceae bacterium]|jgi:dienelactone hydrolase|nr:dienelactone hydrolase family protein [Hyphomicrobiaceae bacterium]